MRHLVRLLVLLMSFAASAAGAQSVTTRITIAHFNDTDQMLPRDGVGGLAEAMTIIRRLRAENPNTILTFGGDMFSPSLMSGFDKGAHIVALTGAMGVEVGVLGNHEFDFGPEEAKARLKESAYPWLSANTLENGRPMEGLSPSFIRDIAGVKIGFFGVTTERANETTSSGPTIRFTDAIEAAGREAKALRAQGAEMVIGLCHMPYIREIALLRTNPEIDICLSGDDHIGFVYADGKQLSLEAGANLDYLGVLDLYVTKTRRNERETTSWRAEPRLISVVGIPPDPAMAARVKHYTDGLDSQLGIPVGTAANEFDTRRPVVRQQESAFANLLADAMRAATNADATITNGGGIRVGRVYPTGYQFTRRDILAEMPFDNKVVLLGLTGAQIRAALENGVSLVENAAGRFAQVSGIAFDYDTKKAPGSRVGTILMNGKPLDPIANYKVATNDFMARGLDGYVMFRDAPRLIAENDGRPVAAVFIDYIAARKTMSGRVEGRIVAK